MVVEDFVIYSQWLSSGIIQFGFIVLTAILLGVFAGYLIAAFRHGPFEAFYVVAQVVGQAVPDFLFTSPRRTIAIARLAIKESLRRKVILVTFGIFAASLLFGGWFMNTGGEHPDQIYVNFVLWGTQMLVLLMGMLISSFSLPEDIKNRTIYTVVTKPVRSTEIVLGRIVGFGALCTALLVVMGVISFFFVWRGLSHDHQIVGETQTIASFSTIPGDKISRITGRRVSDNAIKEAVTNKVAGHDHRIELIEDIREKDQPRPRVESNILSEELLPNGSTKYERIVCIPFGGHTHEVSINKSSGVISLGPAVGYFRARVPIYGESLAFYDRQGNLKEKGLNVGKEWEYRGYVDGGNALSRFSLSKASFDFDDFRESKFPINDIIPIEMTLGVFRTYKADVEKRVTGGIQFESVPVNELAPKFVSEVIDFETNEYAIQTLPIARKILGKKIAPDGKLLEQGEYDLFDDFAGKNGKLKLNLTCRDYNQYLGVAKADLYFRAQDEVYWFNFFKGYIGIWCQMMIIISMGVAFSTFVSAPIAMLGTSVMIIIGFFTAFIREMTLASHEGGGPIESLIRVVTQKNMILDLDTGVTQTVVEQLDKLIVQLLNAMTYLAPNFNQLNFSEFLTYGYAIDSDRILVALTITVGFCAGLTILGYFALKTREIAK